MGRKKNRNIRQLSLLFIPGYKRHNVYWSGGFWSSKIYREFLRKHNLSRAQARLLIDAGRYPFNKALQSIPDCEHIYEIRELEERGLIVFGSDRYLNRTGYALLEIGELLFAELEQYNKWKDEAFQQEEYV